MRSSRRDLAFHPGMGRLLLLLGAALLLLGGSGRALPTPTPNAFNGSSSSSSHSLRYFYTGVSEPGQGLPQFIIVGYVDDKLVSQYDSNTKKAVPRVRWMEDKENWDRETRNLQNTEPWFRASLVNVQKYYNQTGGFHSLQWMVGCELRGGESKGGDWKYAYDGRDYLSFDKETLTYTAVDTQAQRTKRKWEAERANSQYQKSYLEEECIQWLQRHLSYGKETLLRTEPPMGKVMRMARAANDGMETLVCQAHGFYPKEIDTTWKRDGEAWEIDTFRRAITPNSDGTYHLWISVEINPKERDRYLCHMDHAGLSKPLILAWEEPEGWQVNVGLIVGVIVGILAAVLIVAGIVYWIRKPQERTIYKPAPASDKGSDSSVKA